MFIIDSSFKTLQSSLVSSTLTGFIIIQSLALYGIKA